MRRRRMKLWCRGDRRKTMSGKGVLGIAAAVILLMGVAYYAMPNPGKKALKGEVIAMNNVTSWRITTEVSSNGRILLKRTHAAMCPDKERIVEMGLDNISEYVRLGDDIYYRKGNMKWVKGTPGPDLFTDRKSTRLNSSHLVISYAVF